jgi:hypothetical protein
MVPLSAHAGAALASSRYAGTSGRRLLADQYQAFDRGFPLWQFALGNLMMYCAASRSVTSGFQPGNMIGSKNR